MGDLTRTCSRVGLAVTGLGLFISGCGDNSSEPTPPVGNYCADYEQSGAPDPNTAWRFARDGWTFVHVEGDPCEYGYQHGYLTKDLFEGALQTYRGITLQTMGLHYEDFLYWSTKLYKDKLPVWQLQEMQGIANGLTAAGLATTLDEIILWNVYDEITGNWYPNHVGEVVSRVLELGDDQVPGGGDGSVNAQKFRGGAGCSAFVATGSATSNGEIVIGHTTFDDFWNAPHENFIIDIKPNDGYGIIMQATPGYIDSMTDWFITSAGIVGNETTILNFTAYDVNGVPEFSRIRSAMQYGGDLESFRELLEKGNNGGNANTWLLGDINTGEIAELELGLQFVNWQVKSDGHWTGDNAPEDPRIRNIETTNEGYDDTRVQTGGRRTRWPALIGPELGEIGLDNGQAMLGDHHNVYSGQNEDPAANTICGHYDVDDRSDGAQTDTAWMNPYQPAGSVDGKVTTASMARDMAFSARYGRACGIPFDAGSFVEQHPEWNWMSPYLESRPHRPWSNFAAGDKE